LAREPATCGRPEGLASPPARIVSLVPSLSEALFVLGLGDRVVGVTDWCVHPADAVAQLPKVGGTKDPDLDVIVALRPDLVIANHEENTERAVRKLEAAGLRVWVTYPRTVRDGVALLGELADLGASDALRGQVVGSAEAALERAELERAGAGSAGARVFCPIWREPWMTIGRDTYAHDMLALCGGENVFADWGDRRYPRISLDDVRTAAPDVVLLPDEPYAFGPEHVRELAQLDIPAARSGRIALIDGTWLSWYGPRIVRAIRALSPLLRLEGGRPPTPEPG